MPLIMPIIIINIRRNIMIAINNIAMTICNIGLIAMKAMIMGITVKETGGIGITTVDNPPHGWWKVFQDRYIKNT